VAALALPARASRILVVRQEKHAIVGQRDLARMQPVAAAHQLGMADGMAWGAEW